MPHPAPVLYRLGQAVSDLYFSTFHDLRIHGTHHIPESGCIIAANHVSFFDPPAIGCRLPQLPFYLARKTLFHPPLFDSLLPQLRAIPIDQENPDRKGLKAVIDLTHAGHAVVIFPEGARSLDGTLQDAMPGIGFILNLSRVPVVPARIFGAYEAWPRHGRPRPFHPIHVVFNPPFTPHSPLMDKKEKYHDLGNQVIQRIAAIPHPIPDS